MTKKINDNINNNYAQNPDYRSSKKMYDDVGKMKASEIAHKLNNNESPIAQVSPGAALLRIEEKFNSKSAQAFYKEVKSASPGGGQQQTVFKIKIEKID